jgi:hypothetical protein
MWQMANAKHKQTLVQEASLTVSWLIPLALLSGKVTLLPFLLKKELTNFLQAKTLSVLLKVEQAKMDLLWARCLEKDLLP